VVYDQNGAVFVRRRPAKGIWGGLYEFPLLDEWPLSNAIEAEPIRLEHRLSHLKLELEFRFFELEPHLEYRLGAPFRLIDREEREMLGFPRPFLSVFELLDRRLGAL
jgi:adenine-specific DNA glycosylase